MQLGISNGVFRKMGTGVRKNMEQLVAPFFTNYITLGKKFTPNFLSYNKGKICLFETELL
jgi:hypothetical protein